MTISHDLQKRGHRSEMKRNSLWVSGINEKITARVFHLHTEFSNSAKLLFFEQKRFQGNNLRQIVLIYELPSTYRCFPNLFCRTVIDTVRRLCSLQRTDTQTLHAIHVIRAKKSPLSTPNPVSVRAVLIIFRPQITREENHNLCCVFFSKFCQISTISIHYLTILVT